MSTLSDRTIAESYTELLKTADAAGVTGTLTTVEDGDATPSALQISSSVVRSSGNLEVAGSVTAGTWSAGVISGQYGGTGVNNADKTLTLGGNLTTSGAHTTTLTTTGNTGVTLPTTGTLATLAGTETLTNKTINLANNTLSGTLAVANGGTGATSQQAAINALTGTQTAGRYLRSDGTNATLSTIQAADVPTLNQNTTGSAATLTTGRTFQTNLASTSTATFDGSSNVTPGVTGTLPVGNGGTGQSTANAAFNALAPSQTGNSGKYLTTDGTNTSWATVAGGGGGGGGIPIGKAVAMAIVFGG